MRRADRLFQIVQLLRSRRLITADALAAELQVSPRTVYRDIVDLSASGVPVLGEAGMGYTLRQGFEMPPLAFTGDEIEALAMGGRMVRAWADADLAKAASSALSKIEASVPETLLSRLSDPSFHAPRFPDVDDLTAILKPLRDASRQKHKLSFSYVREDGQQSRRTVRPLALFFWGRTWTLVSWCETRQDLRSFRVDRISQLRTLDSLFKDEPGKTLKDFMKQQKERMKNQPPGTWKGKDSWPAKASKPA